MNIIDNLVTAFYTVAVTGVPVKARTVEELHTFVNGKDIGLNGPQFDDDVISTANQFIARTSGCDGPPRIVRKFVRQRKFTF